MPTWDGTVGNPGMNNSIFALTVFDDGALANLYAGGSFGSAQGMAASSLARWDGFSWTEVGGGVANGVVTALAVNNVAGTDRLFVGGLFTEVGAAIPAGRIGEWDGSTWNTLSGGVNGTGVLALEVFGGDLYVGGSFTTAGGVPATNIARWDGTAWTAVGPGLDASVHTLEVHDDGSGDALYAGGFFFSGGMFISRWDGMAWTPLGTGVNNGVRTLLSHDDGSGPALFAGGDFTTAGGLPVNHIAKWDGVDWSVVGTGLDAPCLALSEFDDGGGTRLFAGGSFTTAGGTAASRIASWDGAIWSRVAEGVSANVHAFSVFDDTTGLGDELFVAGEFVLAGGLIANSIAKLAGCVGSFPLFIRGDCNSDGVSNIADAIQLLDNLFGSLNPPDCLDACDTNDDGQSNIADAIALLNSLFGSPPVPLPPPAVCGPDPTVDALQCLTSPAC